MWLADIGAGRGSTEEMAQGLKGIGIDPQVVDGFIASLEKVVSTMSKADSDFPEIKEHHVSPTDAALFFVDRQKVSRETVLGVIADIQKAIRDFNEAANYYKNTVRDADDRAERGFRDIEVPEPPPIQTPGDGQNGNGNGQGNGGDGS